MQTHLHDVCHTVHDEIERDQTTTIFRIMTEKKKRKKKLPIAQKHNNNCFKPSIADWILKSILFNGSAVRDSHIAY